MALGERRLALRILNQIRPPPSCVGPSAALDDDGEQINLSRRLESSTDISFSKTSRCDI
jgi:hypothetical protein